MSGKRKSLNDVLSNDRSVARQAQGGPASIRQSSLLDDVDDIIAKRKAADFPRKSSWGSASQSVFKDEAGYGKTTPYMSCYSGHKPLIFGGLTIYGGSCITPAVKNADIYIGFDSGMDRTSMQYPWNKGEEVFFHISDMKAPSNSSEFKKLVNWTLEQLKEGKKIHCGCIGGHGRTGTFLAALVAKHTGIKDSVTFVRENYCHKVVESKEQMAFLHKHFGVDIVGGSKSSTSTKALAPISSSKDETIVAPMKGPSIWE